MGLFNSLGQGNNIMNTIQRFQQFKQQFQGNPQQQVQQMLNSGRITQEQYNKAVEMAKQLQQFMK